MAREQSLNEPRFAGNPRDPLAAGTLDHRETQSHPDPAEGGADIAKKQRSMQRHKFQGFSGLWIGPPPTHAARRRSRSASQSSIPPAIATTGNITTLTRNQPKCASMPPEMNEPTAMVPKMQKSLNACTLLRSSGRCGSVTIVVAPTRVKFHPMPSSTSAVQKCVTVMPEKPTAADRNSSARPRATMRVTPKRRMSEPVKKLGAYIENTCHWMPSVASDTDSPQSTIASGAEVIIRFISA